MSKVTDTTARDRIATWINLMQDAKMHKAMRDQEADRQSLERAADLEVVYQDMSWVDEMPEIKKKRLGRRIDPKSREQFAKWVKQTYGWGSRPYLSQLHTSTELIPILVDVNGISPTGARCLFPLAKLREQGYGDHQAEVWRDAISLAGNVAPTESQVRKAVTDFIDRHRPPVPNLASDPRTQAEKRAARRARLLREFDEILAESNREAHDFLIEAQRHYKGHQDVLRQEQVA